MVRRSRILSRSRSFSALLLIPLLLIAVLAPALAQNATLTIEAGQPVAKVSPLHYGLMTEELNHAYDGGLYAELVRNRAFLDFFNLATFLIPKSMIPKLPSSIEEQLDIVYDTKKS